MGRPSFKYKIINFVREQCALKGRRKCENSDFAVNVFIIYIVTIISF